MELFIGKQLQTAAYSFVLGLIFGGLYDIIRIIHILCGIASYMPADEEKRPEKRGFVSFLLFFLGDAAYMLTVTAVFSVFQYWQMSGKFRLFVLLSVLAGYAVWHRTAGRLVMAFSEAIVRFLRRIVLWTIVKPVRFLLKILRKSAGFLYRHTAGRAAELLRRGVRSLCMRNIRRKFRKDIVLQEK
jgi:hypothetical protein